MKRRLILGVVAALAGSVFAAPAANAQVADCTVAKLPPQTIVTNGGGQLNVYPGNVVPYTTTVAGWASGIATCLVNEVAGPPVSCVKAIVAGRPTVTINPQTLQITVDYSGLFAANCSLT